MFALGVAQGTALFETGRAFEGFACSATVAFFGARNANVSHALGAVGRTHAATHSVETLLALRVEKTAPLFAVFALLRLSSSSPVRLWLVAEGAVVAEVLRTVLPAHGPVSLKTSIALWIAQSATLVFLFVAN